MQNSVLDATDILINRHPVVHCRGVQRLFGAGRTKAGEIPRRINESIECIGFPSRRFPARRTVNRAPGFVPVKGITRLIKSNIIGQDDGQIRFIHRHHTAAAAMNHGNGTTPITLPRNAPVPQSVHDLPAAKITRLGPAGDLRLGIIYTQAVQKFRIGQPARPYIGFISDREIGGFCTIRHHHGQYGQIVLAGEIQIPLIMCRAAEDRAGAVFDQDEISDVNRQFNIRQEWVLCPKAGIKT